MKKLAAILPALMLLALNALLIALPWWWPQAPGSEWYKGPLVDHASPYSAAGGLGVLGASLAAFLDLLTALLFVTVRLGRPRPRWLAALTLPLAAVALLLVEGGLRVYLPQAMPTMFLPDAELFWKLTPNLHNFHNVVGGETVSTNSLGWRAPEAPPAKANHEYRVMVLGDSSAYGLGVAEEETFAAGLGRLLAAGLPGKAVQAFNAACPGHTTHQAVKILTEYSELVQPDLVIVAYNNDPALEFFTDRERETGGARWLEAQELLYRSRFYIVLRQVVIGLRRGVALDWEAPEETYRRAVDGRQMKSRVPLPEYRENLETLARLGREGGFTVAFVRMPVNRQSSKFTGERFYNPDYPETLLAFGQESGAPVTDIDQDWQANGVTDFLPDHIFHPDAAGHRRIAERLFADLAEKGILNDAGRAAAPAGETITLRLGYSRITPLHTLLGEVLRRTDIPARYGLTLTTETFQRGDDQASALARLDATFTTEAPAIFFLESQPGWRIVGQTGQLGLTALVVGSGSEIRKPADLAGKRVGVPFDSTPHADLTAWLAEAGLAEGRDVETVDLGLADLSEALSSGRVDAVAIWDPWVNQLLAQSPAQAIRYRPFYSLIAMNGDFLEEHPDAQRRYLCSLRDALLYAREHRTEAVQWAAQTSGFDEKTIQVLLDSSGQFGSGAVRFAITDEASEALERDYLFVHRDEPAAEAAAGWEQFRKNFQAAAPDLATLCDQRPASPTPAAGTPLPE